MGGWERRSEGIFEAPDWLTSSAHLGKRLRVARSNDRSDNSDNNSNNNCSNNSNNNCNNNCCNYSGNDSGSRTNNLCQ